jgi:excisionase family DNA binding protein
MRKQKIENTEGAAAPVMRLYTTEEAAMMWGLSYWTVRAMVLDGRLRPIVNVGKGWKFDGSELGKAKLERL